MLKYQPELIEESKIKEILNSIVPFLETNAGRYWLEHISSFSLKELIAEGLNCIESTGNLDKVILSRSNALQTREKQIKLNETINQHNGRIHGVLTENELSPAQRHEITQLLEPYTPVFNKSDLEHELALLNAWQRERNKAQISGSVQRNKPELNNPTAEHPVRLIPKAIMDISNAGLIQETAEGSHIFINQKESLEELKRAIIHKGLTIPTNKDINDFILHDVNGVLKPYADSTIRTAFPKRQKTS